MQMKVKLLELITIFTLQYMRHVYCACSPPLLLKGVYSLTPLSNKFSTGAVVEVVCAPPYTPENIFQIRCDTSGNWFGHQPSCSARDSSGAKWWMLLLGLVSAVVIIPCTLPRLYFKFIETSPPIYAKPKTMSNRGIEVYSAQPYIEQFQLHPVPPVPRSADLYPESQLYPKPLPPIRQRQQ